MMGLRRADIVNCRSKATFNSLALPERVGVNANRKSLYFCFFVLFVDFFLHKDQILDGMFFLRNHLTEQGRNTQSTAIAPLRP